jgi:hypothetical protein
MPIIIKPLQVVDKTTVILASNPLAWYRFFDEQSQRTLLFDEISNNFSAMVAQRGVSYQQNIIGNTVGGIVTDGVSGFASIPLGSLPKLSTGGAILLNVASRHPTNSPIAQTRILASFIAGNTFFNIEIPANESLLRFNLNDQVFLSGPSATRFTNGSANTVLISTSETGISSVYINGDFIGTIATPFNPVVALFGKSANERFTAAGFCEVVIWDTAIPTTLVNSLTGNIFQTIPDNVVRRVHTTPEDPVAGTLAEEIIEGSGITLTQVNIGGDIKLQIGADFNTVGKLVTEAIEVSLVANTDSYVNFSTINNLSNVIVLYNGNIIYVSTSITSLTQAKINSGVSLNVTVVGIGSK